MSAIFESGAKSSEEKPRYDLIPMEALRREAVRMAEGAKAHGENNYHKGMGDAAFVRDRVNHAIEHLLKYASGDRTEDHLAAVRANTGMLIWLESANRSETTTPPKIETTAWAIGRFYCPVCNHLGAVVRHPDAEIACPKCGGPCDPASGDERR